MITNVNVTTVNVTKINYTNVQVRNAVVATSADRFGHGGQSYTHIPANDLGRWHPSERGIEVKPTAASLVPGEGRAVRPPREVMDRPVVANREPREPLAKIREELLRVRLMLEPGDEVVREAHDDDITVRVAFSPPLGPPVKDIVEVDVRQ